MTSLSALNIGDAARLNGDIFYVVDSSLKDTQVEVVLRSAGSEEMVILDQPDTDLPII